MTPISLLEGAAGFLLAALTLRDVFHTVVVPGRVRGSLKLSRRFVFLALPVWKRLLHEGIGVNFAPVVLVAAFTSWMLLLMVGFALMLHAAAATFSPPIEGFGTALYLAGSAMTTIGFGHAEPRGIGAVLSVAAGFCGLAVMTLAVTYLLEVQSNIAIRDTGVLKITTTSGRPPSALALLERYAELGCRDELRDLLRHARDWCAMVMQSHISHPSLIYFRSAGTASGWPATLGAMADLALVHEHLLADEGLRGLAVLLREEAQRLAAALGELLALAPRDSGATVSDLEVLRERLRACGYALRDDVDATAFLAARHAVVGGIDALSAHLGNQAAPLVPKNVP